MREGGFGISLMHRWLLCAELTTDLLELSEMVHEIGMLNDAFVAWTLVLWAP